MVSCISICMLMEVNWHGIPENLSFEIIHIFINQSPHPNVFTEIKD